jgi:hypothetical protein
MRKSVKLGEVIEIELGRCLRDGQPVLQCYVCNKPAPDWPWPDGPACMAYGFAVINGGELLPICEACFSSATATHAIARKFLGVPDLKFTESGAASPEEFRQIASALAEKEDATQH